MMRTRQVTTAEVAESPTALAALKDFESDGSLPEDARRRADKAVQDLTDQNTKQIDTVTNQKEEEILQV